MKVLLLKNHNKKFKSNVKNGYAKNHLFAKNLAVLATRKNILTSKKNILKNILYYNNRFKEKVKILNNITLLIPTQARKDKQLYESINSKKIIKLIKKLGFKVNNNNIVNNILIKKTGKYIMKLNLNNNIDNLIFINIIIINIYR